MRTKPGEKKANLQAASINDFLLGFFEEDKSGGYTSAQVFTLALSS